MHTFDKSTFVRLPIKAFLSDVDSFCRLRGDLGLRVAVHLKCCCLYLYLGYRSESEASLARPKSVQKLCAAQGCNFLFEHLHSFLGVMACDDARMHMMVVEFGSVVNGSAVRILSRCPD